MKPRYMTNHRKDLSEGPILEALEKAGFLVWDHLPTDLLTWRIDKGWLPIEAKTPYGKEGKQAVDKRQQKQIEFLQATGCPIALTAEQALRAVGVIG